MAERVAVIGAGMAGLFAALALARTGRRLILFERDPPPPEGDLEAAFADWARRGVGHLRHSHGFLARLQGILAREEPALLAELIEAGAREIRFADWLPPPARERYRPSPEDQALTAFVSRRTTVEVVMRRAVERLPNVESRSGVFVRDLLIERRGRSLVATGLAIETAGRREDVAADIVVDAGGRSSPGVDALARAGATLREESEGCGIVYFTRFYRLRPGQTEPPRGPHGATGDLGYLKFGLFRADNGTFSVTLAVPEVEQTLRTAVVRPQIFERICASLPGVAPWVEAVRSAPITRVLGMGDLVSRWRDFAPGGAPAALGFFAVGDALVRTNPLYGRGCTFAAVEAYALRDALAASEDPTERLRSYGARVREALRGFYDDMLSQDRAAVRRALQALEPTRRPSWLRRVAVSFARDGLGAAVRSDPELLRQALRAFHMLDPPGAWARRPATAAKALGAWLDPRSRAQRPPRAGPARADLFTELQVSAGADLERIRAAP